MPPVRFAKRHRLAPLLLGAVLLLSGPVMPAADPDLIVIANPTVGVSEITAEEFTRVFLLKTNTLRNGDHVVPIVGRSASAYDLFLKKYMRRTDAALNTYYRSLLFTGKALMPKFVNSDAEAVLYVSKTRDAIGFVSPGARLDGVKTLSLK